MQDRAAHRPAKKDRPATPTEAKKIKISELVKKKKKPRKK
jgi:hypothetical protein